MDLRPWSYWTRDGQPYEETRAVQAALEQVLRAAPEPSGRAAPVDSPVGVDRYAEARRSGSRSAVPLMPGAGHIVHMPAHIYQRVGRHADVISVEPAGGEGRRGLHRAVPGAGRLSARPTTRTTCTSSGWARRRAGRRQLALESARKLAEAVPHEALGTVPILQGFLVVPYWAMVRFRSGTRSWPTRGPRTRRSFTRGVWHYARAMALVNRGRLDEAERELARAETLVADPALKGQTTFSANTGFAILRIAPEVVAGEIALEARRLGSGDRCISSAPCATRMR